MVEIGICFMIPNQFGQVLHTLLKDILEIPSTWRINEHAEILKMSSDGEPADLLPNNVILKNTDMEHYLSQETYPIMISFFIYFSEQPPYPVIKDIGEFLASPCDIAVCISDSTQVIVTAKDAGLLDKVKDKMEKISFSNLRYVDQGEDSLMLS
ncbi:DUF2691 family protein [Lentibacillus sediminis]|uniref:DUF2691 family protein n=1 Tax=Lentibacillus sediminis TaxID=1940529 RepID=UPI000C1C5D17|nr:DUF2691 family protein [Lentibacillus sediminis]